MRRGRGERERPVCEFSFHCDGADSLLIFLNCIAYDFLWLGES